MARSKGPSNYSRDPRIDKVKKLLRHRGYGASNTGTGAYNKKFGHRNHYRLFVYGKGATISPEELGEIESIVYGIIPEASSDVSSRKYYSHGDYPMVENESPIVSELSFRWID